MTTPYSPQHRWMEWLVDVQVASRGCGSPVCLHTSWLGTAVNGVAEVGEAGDHISCVDSEPGTHVGSLNLRVA